MHSTEETERDISSNETIEPTVEEINERTKLLSRMLTVARGRLRLEELRKARRKLKRKR